MNQPLNIIAVLDDATTITGQADSREKAVERVLEWSSEEFYMGSRSIVRVFFGNKTLWDETTLEDLQQEIIDAQPHGPSAADYREVRS